MNNGYSICFNKWVLDNNIKNEFRLLLIISSLTAETGYCFAGNKYLADIFNETEISISNKIKKLEKNNYIEIEYEKRGCEIVSRKIRLKNILTDDKKIFYSTIKKNFKDNNTSINNKENNNINIITKERFKKPTLEEVEEYCKKRNSSVDAKTFYEYFETGNWVDSKGNKVKNWKQKIITWENNRKKVKTKEEPKWFNKEQELENMTQKEQEELEGLIDELCDIS